MDWLEAVAEEDSSTPPAVQHSTKILKHAEAVLSAEADTIAQAAHFEKSTVLEDRKKAAGEVRKKSSGEARKKSSVSKGEAVVGGKRRKSSLFLRLKNFKSLPNLHLPKIFKLSKLLKREKSQPSMAVTAATTSATPSPLAAVQSSIADGNAVIESKLQLGAGSFDGPFVALIAAGGWKRRRKGRIRTVLIVRQVRRPTIHFTPCNYLICIDVGKLSGISQVSC